MKSFYIPPTLLEQAQWDRNRPIREQRDALLEACKEALAFISSAFLEKGAPSKLTWRELKLNLESAIAKAEAE